MNQQTLKTFLKYNQRTGTFTWLQSRGPVSKGSVAGTVDSKGYIQIGIEGKLYAAHRLAHLYVTGRMPPYVDHRDGNTQNNKWINLRQATLTQNQYNRRLNKNNSVGLKGVTRHANGRYAAQIQIAGKKKRLGYFDTAEDAHAAYMAAAKEGMKTFACDGNR